MPAWDYKCETGGHIFTVEGRLEDFVTRAVCPECSLKGDRYYSGQVVSIHNGPTTSAASKTTPWRSAGAER